MQSKHVNGTVHCLSQVLVPCPGSVDSYQVLGRERLHMVTEEAFLRLSKFMGTSSIIWAQVPKYGTEWEQGYSLTT